MIITGGAIGSSTISGWRFRSASKRRRLTRKRVTVSSTIAAPVALSSPSSVAPARNLSRPSRKRSSPKSSRPVSRRAFVRRAAESSLSYRPERSVMQFLLCALENIVKNGNIIRQEQSKFQQRPTFGGGDHVRSTGPEPHSTYG